MATLDNNNTPSGDDARSEIISKLDYNKQFSLRQRLSLTEELSRQEAIEALKDSLVHTAYKEQTYLRMLKQELIEDKPV